MTAHATELADLDKTRQAHIAALNAGDAHRWAACFAADAVQMPPNDPPNASPESIRAWSNAFLAAFAVKFSLRPDEVTLTGADWAFERGTYTITLMPAPGGAPVHDVGKYISGAPTIPGSWPVTSGIATTRCRPAGLRAPGNSRSSHPSPRSMSSVSTVR